MRATLLSRGDFSGARCFGARIFLGKFETDFAIIKFEMGGKRTPFFRDKFRQEIGLAGRDQLLHLLFRDGAMLNRFAYAERAFFRRGSSALANVGAFEIVNLPLIANWTKADGFVPRGIDLLRRAVSALAEIKFQFEIFAQLHRRVKAASHFVAESLERTNPSLCEKFLHFGGLK